MHDTANPRKDFNLAQRMIKDILLDFQLPNLPKVRLDGSAGRLIYEIGECYAGTHRPKKSKSDVIMTQYNPFDGNQLCCMTLVELPSVEGQTHGNYLQNELIESNIKKIGC